MLVDLPWVDRQHVLTSAIAVPGVLGSMVAILLARRRGGRPTPVVGLAGVRTRRHGGGERLLPVARARSLPQAFESFWLAMMGRYASPVGRSSLPGYPSREAGRYRLPR